mgnify:CR=1 FL=1
MTAAGGRKVRREEGQAGGKQGEKAGGRAAAAAASSGRGKEPPRGACWLPSMPGISSVGFCASHRRKTAEERGRQRVEAQQRGDPSAHLLLSAPDREQAAEQEAAAGAANRALVVAATPSLRRLCGDRLKNWEIDKCVRERDERGSGSKSQPDGRAPRLVLPLGTLPRAGCAVIDPQ